jgi:DNA replicative helicase MCM subunit Mcm2 (Cdc46/Mcm family)
MSETIEMVDVERTTHLMTRSFVELGLDPDEGAVVEVDESGATTVDSAGAPEVVIKRVVDQLKFEGSDYGAERDTVLDRAAPDVDSKSKADLDDIVETMLKAETLHSTSDGRLS